MWTECKKCKKSINRRPCIIAKRNVYCNNKCQLTYEYANGIRDKKTIADKAHEAVKQYAQERWDKGIRKRSRGARGYIFLQTPKGPVYEHRWIWEQANEPIPKGWIIHHKNGNKQDNRLENLECMSEKKHLQHHYKNRKLNILGQLE